jgi:hypothetical protein
VNTDDLLKLLDLGGADALPAMPSGVVLAPADVMPSADASPTALAVDAWGLRRGRDLRAESARLAALDVDDFAAADFFASAFDPDPRLLPACRDGRRRDFLALLLETPDFKALHAATRLDDLAAGIAAAHFAEQVCKLRQEDAAATGGDSRDRDKAALRAAGRALTGAREELSECRGRRRGPGPGSG